MLASLGLSACGGGDATPVSTTQDGTAVYGPDAGRIALTAGPRFVIDMPVPETGWAWRLFTIPDDMGGVSLKGIAGAQGGGAWTFETIGAGSGTLEFRRVRDGDGNDVAETSTIGVRVS